ncbi:MAG: hypothetical protein ACRDZY_08190, partial [Acidimicrobiales bacterium]
MSKLTDLPGQVAAKLPKSVGQYVERGSAELHYVRTIFKAGGFK